MDPIQRGQRVYHGESLALANVADLRTAVPGRMGFAQQPDLGHWLAISYHKDLDRRRSMVMIILREDWNLRQWYDWLEEEMDLRIGRDFRWAWVDNHWAIEFHDPRVETAVRIKAQIE